MDILVSNAGAYPRRSWPETTPTHWEDALATNLTCHYLLARELTPAMAATGWGRVITIGSVLATAGRHELAGYISAKAGLEGLTRALARELGPAGVTANCVAPGSIRVPAEDTVVDDPEAMTLRQLARQCVQRRGRRLPRHRGRRLHHRPDPARRRRLDPWLTSGSCATAPTKATAPATTPHTKPPSRRRAATRYTAPSLSPTASPRSSPAPSPEPARPPDRHPRPAPHGPADRRHLRPPRRVARPEHRPRPQRRDLPARLSRLASPAPRQPVSTLRRRRKPHRPPHPRPPLRHFPPPHRPTPRPPPGGLPHPLPRRPHASPRRPRRIRHRREGTLALHQTSTSDVPSAGCNRPSATRPVLALH